MKRHTRRLKPHRNKVGLSYLADLKGSNTGVVNKHSLIKEMVRTLKFDNPLASKRKAFGDVKKVYDRGYENESEIAASKG